MRVLACVVATVILSSGSASLGAHASGLPADIPDPWGSSKEFNESHFPYSPGFFQSSIALYHDLKAEVSSQRCQFHPSCSRYSYLSFELTDASRAMVQTFRRLYRCNASARGLYPEFQGYLIDVPPQLTYPTRPAGTAPSLTMGTTYGEWLLEHEAWESAYDHFLSKEYSAPSSRNRRALALTSLNTGRSDVAHDWVRADTSAVSTALSAVACYRMGRHVEALEAGRRAMSTPLDCVPRSAGAVVTLCSSMRSLKTTVGPDERAALRVLYPEREAESYASQMRSLGSRPRSWPFGVASLIPGVGQAANGYVSDGIVAFMVCSLLGLATASSAHEGNDAGTTLFGIMSAYAYMANIAAGAAAPVRKWDDSRKQLTLGFYVRFDPTAALDPDQWLEER